MFRGFGSVTDDANAVLAALQNNPGFMAKVSEGPGFDYSVWAEYMQFVNAVRSAPNGEETASRLQTIRRWLSTAPAAVDNSSYVAIVTQDYRQYLNREPDAEGLNFWVNELATGRKTRQDLVNAFLVSGEYLAAHPIAGASPAPGVAGAGDLTPGTAAAPAGSSNLMLYAGIAIAAYFLLK